MNRLIALLSILFSAGTSSRAIECGPLKSEIDQKIKATAVTNYTLLVADSAASAPGKLVGTCENGTKKIYYVQGAASGAQALRPASSTQSAGVVAKPGSNAMLTECKPGYSGTDCKTRSNAP